MVLRLVSGMLVVGVASTTGTPSGFASFTPIGKDRALAAQVLGGDQ